MKKFIFLTTAALMATLNAGAETYFCSPTGAGEGDGSSWENAFEAASINDVVENVEPGDIVYLLEGRYTGARIRPVSGITIIGGYPASSKGTDLSLYNPWKYKTIFDAEGKNGIEALVKISGEDGVEAPLTTLKGITITGCIGQKDDDDSYHGTAFNCTRAYVLLEDMVFDGNQTIKGGVVVPASGSRFHARHCVWINNKNVRTNVASSDGSNNCFQAVLSARGSSDNMTNIVLEGCVMVNNTIENAAARAAACYGGMMNFQDGGTNLAMVNCFADGDGMSIKQNGGFMRMGNNGELCLLAFNTLYNFQTTAAESKGHILSINGNIPYYLQGNIIVDNTQGTTVIPNYETGTVSNGNKKDIAIFTQGFSNNHGARVPYIQSGGDNTIGGFLVATIQKDQNGEPGSMYKTSFLSEFTSDNWSAPAQSDVFSGTTTEKDGRYFILPKDNYCDVNLQDALDNFDSYKGVPAYDCFKWAQIDLSKDLFGNKRAATTYRGAYDPNASDSTPTGIISVNAAGHTLTVKSIGNGEFSIENIDGYATVHDMTGRMVLATDVESGSRISLTDMEPGIYVIRVGANSVKVIR